MVCPAPLSQALRANTPDIRVMGSGEAIEIYKEVGYPTDVAARFDCGAAGPAAQAASDIERACLDARAAGHGQVRRPGVDIAGVAATQSRGAQHAGVHGEIAVEIHDEVRAGAGPLVQRAGTTRIDPRSLKPVLQHEGV